MYYFDNWNGYLPLLFIYLHIYFVNLINFTYVSFIINLFIMKNIRVGIT